MSKDTDAFYAKHVNGAWPEVVPPLTDGEARTAALHQAGTQAAGVRVDTRRLVTK